MYKLCIRFWMFAMLWWCWKEWKALNFGYKRGYCFRFNCVEYFNLVFMIQIFYSIQFNWGHFWELLGVSAFSVAISNSFVDNFFCCSPYWCLCFFKVIIAWSPNISYAFYSNMYLAEGSWMKLVGFFHFYKLIKSN